LVSARIFRIGHRCPRLAVPVAAQQASGLTTQFVNTNDLTALEMAKRLVGEGIDVSGADLAGGGTGVEGGGTDNTVSSGCAGVFGGGQDIIGFEDGLILSSGNIADVVGPNDTDGQTTSYGALSDADLNALLAATGHTSFDACSLTFDFTAPAGGGAVSFDYVFSSEEYNEYTHTSFNDVFGFFIRPTPLPGDPAPAEGSGNCAIVPGTADTPVAIDTINAGNPDANPPTDPVNPHLYRNNDIDNVAHENLINTEMDGLTVVLTCFAEVTPGQSYRVKLAIADAGDTALDSNVFIRGASFGSTKKTVPLNPGNGGDVDSGEGGLQEATVHVPGSCVPGGGGELSLEVVNMATEDLPEAPAAGAQLLPLAFEVLADPPLACTGGSYATVQFEFSEALVAGADPTQFQLVVYSPALDQWVPIPACAPSGAVPAGTLRCVAFVQPPAGGEPGVIELHSTAFSLFALANAGGTPPAPQPVTCGGKTPTLTGSGSIQGTNKADVILGSGGNDVITGANGDDVICAGGGDDKIAGGNGNDTTFGEAGADQFLGDNGDDVAHGGDGDDVLWGHNGNDVLNGEANNDQMYGGNGADTLTGGDGDDRLQGDNAKDACNGGPGVNTLVTC
jgi:hypothetical protein